VYNGGGATNPLDRPITFDERRHGGEDFGNGDGLLAYPGPLPSLRLKALRRGLSDRLLLAELAACGKEQLARSVALRMVPRALGEASGAASWPTDEASWERARRELLRAVVFLRHAGQDALLGDPGLAPQILSQPNFSKPKVWSAMPLISSSSLMSIKLKLCCTRRSA
jgi:hypothetical protein